MTTVEFCGILEHGNIETVEDSSNYYILEMEDTPMLNTYGLKMLGLESAAAETADWPTDKGYTKIYYNPADGQILARTHVVERFTTHPVDPAAKLILTARERMTAQEIADAIAAALGI